MENYSIKFHEYFGFIDDESAIKIKIVSKNWIKIFIEISHAQEKPLTFGWIKSVKFDDR